MSLTDVTFTMRAIWDKDDKPLLAWQAAVLCGMSERQAKDMFAERGTLAIEMRVATDLRVISTKIVPSAEYDLSGNATFTKVADPDDNNEKFV